MKFKNVYSLAAFFLVSAGLSAQVGINTPNPQATLDIVGNGNSTTVKDGLMPPRLSKQQLAAKVAGTYGTAQMGTLVYITDVAAPSGTTPSISQVSLINTPGYHQFDGTQWKAVSHDDVNIYNSDGNLTGNRIVTQAANTLAFRGGAVNAFSVNNAAGTSSILSVDGANSRVGVGTGAPIGRFDVVSDNIGNTQGNDYYFRGFGTSTNPAIFLLSARGTEAAPTNLLAGDIAGSLYFGSKIQSGSSAYSSIVSAYRGDGATTLTDLVFNTSNGEKMRIDPLGNVGIGTTNPSVKLDVNSGGTSAAPVAALKVVDGNQAAGKVLTSDASGVATWQTVGTGTNVNIYNSDGSLTGNRIATLGANNLTFSSTTGTFSVQTNNNGFQRSAFTNTNTGASSRMDVSVGTGTGSVYLGVDNGSAIFGAGVKAYLDNRSNGRLAFGTQGVEHMTLATTGNFGIGSTAPTRKLHVEGASYFNAAVTTGVTKNAIDINIGQDGLGYGNRNDNFGINVRSSSSIGGGSVARINFGDTSTGTAGTGKYLSFSVGTTLNELMYMTDNNSGRVGIGTTAPTEKLHVIGNILASGTVTPSDIRIKKDIVDNGYGLNELLKLRTINYKYKDERLSKDKKVGFVAQEIQAAMPELVTTANDEMKTLGVNYAEMTVVLTKAVQQQQELIKEQQTQIDELKARLEKVEAKK
ncbi:tail fiber domain-containing protein [Chryseobacterium sp. MYb264]|uniref:tail fiber domain-containing protein n=1 Tax=Chryseobacterium sp. MYb264 TaxID=2745153 RepID=UPI002E13D7C9|nr:tail fiber domain-containing protein [Chryseobacterium sp. MYb264]